MAVAVDDPTRPMIGQVLGSYRLTAQIGSGGMGVVYAAENAALGRRAAIKILRSEISADAEMVKRFFNEARAATLIKHPGMVQIYDFGTYPNGSAYLVMEYLEGESLWAVLRRERRLPVERIVAIGQQIASTLAAAHATGIVHRDLKPANLFLVDDPGMPLGKRVKVLDFGIAKLSGDAASIQSLSGVTGSGRILGTPTYMAPEQCRGAGGVDARADVYALGCILFQMAAGRPPFEGSGAGDMITAHLIQPPPRTAESRRDLPTALTKLIDRCMAKQREQRPQNMQEIVTVLDSLKGVTQTTPLRGPEPEPISAVRGPQSVTMTSSDVIPRVVAEPTGARVRRALGRRWLWLVGAVLALVAAGLAGRWVASRGVGGPAPGPQTSPAVVAVDAAMPPPVPPVPPPLPLPPDAAPPLPDAAPPPDAAAAPARPRRPAPAATPPAPAPADAAPAASPPADGPDAGRPPLDENTMDPFSPAH
jgi:serine/threonine-protein kinase